MNQTKELAADLLYEKIRLDFFQKVYSGEILPFQQLPAERKQAEDLSVSRGTIRKARQMLMDEGFISSTQGSAAVYTPLKNRKSNRLDIAAVIVPVHNPFFMSYYRAFEKAAEEKDVLVMIKQLDNSNADRLEKVLFSLFLKGIKDIVFWPYDTALEYQCIQRLSGLGMNVIFFDSVHEFGFCDYISVDNRHGISCLYEQLKSKGAGSVAYIGWDNQLLTSNLEREQAFGKLQSRRDRIIRLPWNQEQLDRSVLEDLLNPAEIIDGQGIDGFLCGNGHIGITLRDFLNRKGYGGIPVCSMDNFEESESLDLTVYEQPFDRMGRKTFELLHGRHTQTEEWQSDKYYIKGRMIER